MTDPEKDTMDTSNSRARTVIPTIEPRPGTLPLGHSGLFQVPMPIPMPADRVLPPAVAAEIDVTLAALQKGRPRHHRDEQLITTDRKGSR